MSSVDQDGQLHRTGPTQVREPIEGCSHRAAGVEDIVDEDDGAAPDVDRDRRATQTGTGAPVEVVPVQPDVQLPYRDLHPFEPFDALGDGVSEWDSPGVDTDQDDVRGTVMAFDDLVSDTPYCPVDVGSVQGGGVSRGQGAPFRPRGTGLKGWLGCHRHDTTPLPGAVLPPDQAVLLVARSGSGPHVGRSVAASAESTPLTNAPDLLVEYVLASLTASLTITATGTSG